MTRRKTINLVALALLLAGVGGLAYFGTLNERFTGDMIEPAAGVASNAAMSEQQAPAGMAEFKASCVVGDGQVVTGSVTVPQHQNPSMLKDVEVETNVGRMVVAQGTCEYAPH